MVTNQHLNELREPGCWAILADKKYYRVGNSCIKRTLRRHEWQSAPNGSLVVPPTSYVQRWKTDATILEYLRKHTNIPLPKLQCTFEDDGAFYHLTELVEGVSMTELSEDKKQVVMKELSMHVATMHSLTSKSPGVPGQLLLCPPQRVFRGQWKINSCWKPRVLNEDEEYRLCHNDLGQHNVIVDPDTLEIKAIIDWEFAGFWPEWFDRPFWQRVGPSSPLGDEEDDVERCREWLMKHCDEVVMPCLEGMKDEDANEEKSSPPHSRSNWEKSPILHVLCVFTVSLAIYLFKKLMRKHLMHLIFS